MLRFLVLLVAFSTACGLRAQVVNIEGRRFANDTVPWTGYVNFRYNIAENTQRSLNLGINGALQHVRDKNTWFFINDIALNRVENNSFLNTGFQHLRYNYNRDQRWTGEAFAQTQYNKPLKLDLRTTLGAGYRFRVITSERYKMYVGSSMMLEYEKTTPGPEYMHPRSNTYASATGLLSDQMSVACIVYYQPRLFNAYDHRIMLEASVIIRATARLTLESRLNLLKDTHQPEGIPELTYSWVNMFGYRF